MKVQITSEGTMVDASDLGPILGLEPREVPEKMRSGEITSQSEEGIGDDSGKIRLTFWYLDRRVRFVCDKNGNVLKTSRSKTGR